MKMTDKTRLFPDAQVQVFDRNSTFPGSARMIGVIDLSLRKVLSEQNRRCVEDLGFGVWGIGSGHVTVARSRQSRTGCERRVSGMGICRMF